MKTSKKLIAIITQPLQNNYGGLLQNFALQKVLRNLGYESFTFDYMKVVIPSLGRFLLSWLKTICLFFGGKKRRFSRYSHKGRRNSMNETFLKSYISKTSRIYKYDSKLLEENGVDMVIVGSDQVWRPIYNFQIEDMFLKFAEKFFIKRISYAASFGVDEWEYTRKQTKVCSALAKKFDAISIREESGVKLCKEHLGVDAAWVLDPTLLLTKNDYLPICESVPVRNEKYLAVYVLNESEDVISVYENESRIRGLVVKKFYADSKSTLSVPEWLAMFRDASYVVTDSFHGTVFSIIFGKEFKCVYNESRGSARFESLLKLYNSRKIDEMREFSINWLKKALES